MAIKRPKLCPNCKVMVIPVFGGKCGACLTQINRQNKYKAVGTRLEDGKYFPSKGEASRAQALQLKEKSGLIFGLKFHPTVEIFPGLSWKLDSTYVEEGTQFYEDFKGVMARETMLKIKLWEYFGPGPLRIVKMDYNNKYFKVTAEYKPKGMKRFMEDFKSCQAP